MKLVERLAPTLLRPISPLTFVLIGVLAQITVSAVGLVKGFDVAPEGPIARLSEGARALWESGRLDPPRYYPLFTELRARSAQEHSFIWEDMFGVTRDGRLVPPHCVPLMVAAAPFVGLLGDTGLWILNQLLLIGVSLSCYALFVQIRGTRPPLLLAALFLSTPFAFFAPTLGYDQLNAVLLAGGTALLGSRPGVAALLVTFSLTVRLSNVLSFPLLFSEWIRTGRRTREIFLWGAAGLALVMLYNTVLWGKPLIDARERLVWFVDGAVEFYRPDFSWAIFAGDWWEKLFGSRVGLLLFAPILLASPLTLRGGSNSSLCRLSWFWHAVFLANALLMFSFGSWMTGGNGNRYLFPQTLLLGTLVIVRLEHYLRGYLPRTSEAAPNSASIPESPSNDSA